MFSAQAAGQSPAAGRDVGHLGDGLHLLRTADAHLQGAETAVRESQYFCIETKKDHKLLLCSEAINSSEGAAPKDKREEAFRVAFTYHIVDWLGRIFIPEP